MLRAIVFLVLCAVSAASFADDKSIRFGLQASMNSYKTDDPVGKTDNATGLSVSGIALFDLGRETRAMLNINHDSYSLTGSQTTVGEDVSSFGGGLSYQKMLRVSRSWRPWVGVGLGYTSTTQSNRYTVTPGGSGHVLYADYKTTNPSFLLNTNTEWEYNRDFNIGVQAQYSKNFSDKASTLRVGLYIVY